MKVENTSNSDKREVHQFWNEASCGESLYLSGVNQQAYEEQARIRYELEPYILEFAQFEDARGKRVLEIGVGLGADHKCFAENGAHLHGIDLTERAIEHTRRRLTTYGLSSSLNVGDAENLDFPNDYFDLVYSWGVIHHSPDTDRVVSEIHRVLKPSGKIKIMIYHKWSMIGLMLWLRYGLLRLRPLISLSTLYSRYLESPGTKAYSKVEAQNLVSLFSDVKISTVLTHGDLLESDAGQRHRGPLLAVAKTLWPRALIRKFLSGAGLFMLIQGVKD